MFRLFSCRVKVLVAGSFLLGLFGLSVFADTQVEASGMAALAGNTAKAREKALDQALRSAVEQAVGTLVSADATVENYQLLDENIYTRSKGYVSSYDVLKEGTDNDLGVYRVTILAQVGKDQLANDLAGLNLVLGRLNMPRTAVALAGDAAEARAYLEQQLINKGFHLVDAQGLPGWSMEQLAANAKKSGADLLIYGEADTGGGERVAGSALKSMHATLSLKGIWTGSGRVLASNTGDATVAHSSGHAGLNKAVLKAARKTTPKFLSQLTKSLAQDAFQGRWISLEVRGMWPKGADRLKKRLEGVDGISQVRLRQVAKGKAEFDVEVRGGSNILAQEVRRFGVVVSSVKDEAISGYIPKKKEQDKKDK